MKEFDESIEYAKDSDADDESDSKAGKKRMAIYWLLFLSRKISIDSEHYT